MNRYKKAREHMLRLGFSAPVSFTNAVLFAEALDRGVEVGRGGNGRRILLRRDGRTCWWQAGNSSLNAALALKVVKYKDVCSRLLRNHHVNAPENSVFSVADIERAWRWSKSLGKLVVKPHDGIQGRGVHVGITTRRDFEEAFHQVAETWGEVLVEKFHDGIEHRCLVVDNVLVAATRRRPASVLGDGQSTIAHLVDAKNRDRGLIHKRLSLNTQAMRTLALAEYSPESVPKEGERVYLLEASNIHTGGDAIDATDEISYDERKIIEDAAQALPGLRIAGFDALFPRNRQGKAVEPTILEINHNPMISMHHFPWSGEPRNVSKTIIEAMFPRLKAG